MVDKNTSVEVKREPAQPGALKAAEWEPFRALRHQFDRLMDIDWPDLQLGWPRRPAIAGQTWPEMGVAVPPVDLVERNGGYELQVELPGMTKDQIDIKFADGMMTIKGEKSAERVEDKEDYYLQERSYGSFQRTFRVPASVDADKIEAKFENGLLKVTLPKSAAAIKQERKIEVKAA